MRKMVIEQMDEAMADIMYRKTPLERLHLASDLSEFLRQMMRTHLRHQHPDWTEKQLQKEVIRRCFGVNT